MLADVSRRVGAIESVVQNKAAPCDRLASARRPMAASSVSVSVQSESSDSDDSERHSRPSKRKRHDAYDDEVSLFEDGEIDDDPENAIISKNDSNAREVKADGCNLVEKIEQEFDVTEKVSADIDESIAKLVKDRFGKKQTTDSVKQRSEQIHRPANCPQLVVPTVNNCVWSGVPDKKRKADVNMARTQRAVIKAAVCVAQIADDAMNKNQKLSSEERMKCCTHAVSLLGFASRDLSMLRRKGVSQHTGDLGPFWDDTELAPITGELFGDDISGSQKKARQLSATRKAMRRNDREDYRRRDFLDHRSRNSKPWNKDGRNQQRQKSWYQQKKRRPSATVTSSDKPYNK